MKVKHAIEYDEDKIYAFTATTTVQEQWQTQYPKKEYSHIFILGGGRSGDNLIKGTDYNKFSAMSLTLGKQVLMSYDSFSEFVKELNSKNIDLFIFDSVIEFTLWVLKETSKETKLKPEGLLSILKEHFPNELEAMFKLYNDDTYFSQSVLENNNQRYGCDSCGWVYNDTDEK